MNATSLYAQLSQKVLFITDKTEEGILKEFMRSDKGFFKLRSLLLCRSCRQLCVDPLSSEFCQHLLCQQCFQENQTYGYGCKWCKSKENLMADTSSKILVGLYKNLCAILHDFVTGSIERTGTTREKEKLLRFLDEGCTIPDIVIEKKPVIEPSIKTKKVSKLKSETTSEHEKIVDKTCSCCCTCKNKTNIGSDKDISNDPIKITAAQSSGISLDEETSKKSPETSLDNVSSTVPDAIPVENSVTPATNENQNKYGDQKDGGESSSKIQNPHLNVSETQSAETKDEHFLNSNDPDDTTKITPSKFYKTLSSISLKERKNRNIFEKFGLALSPPESVEDTINVYSVKQKKKKHFKGAVYKEQKKKTKKEPKIQPLKLKVKKIGSSSSSYKVHYNVSNAEQYNVPNGEQNIDSAIENDDDVLLNNNTPNEYDKTASILKDFDPPQPRKVKRKATFISNYAIFSDDSDFEIDYSTKKKSRKTSISMKDKDICGCGAGSKVKYFTDICKRSRCPCFAQGRSCVNCKCRFCSNPFLLDDEVEESYSDSDSSNDQPLSHLKKDELELVDVEA